MREENKRKLVEEYTQATKKINRLLVGMNMCKRLISYHHEKVEIIEWKVSELHMSEGMSSKLISRIFMYVWNGKHSKS